MRSKDWDLRTQEFFCLSSAGVVAKRVDGLNAIWLNGLHGVFVKPQTQDTGAGSGLVPNSNRANYTTRVQCILAEITRF